jgi:hypothetical protein
VTCQKGYIKGLDVPCLDENARESSQRQFVGTGPEAIDITSLADALLFSQIGANVVQLDLDFWSLWFETEKTRQRPCSICVASSLDQPAW